MTMIDIFKKTLSELPVELEILKAKEFGSKWKLTMGFRGTQTSVELSKACTPNEAENYCWQVVATAMSSLYMNLGDLQKARLWLNSLNNKSLITADNA